MPDRTGAGRAESEPRLDVHNTSVNEGAAAGDRCGTVDVATGRVCQLPALHSGGCEFQEPPKSAV